MLLNASHEITNCGLPQHVQERYVRYKQGNRAIVAWMTKYGPEKYKGKKTLPIKQLITLGNFLCGKIQEIGTLPSDVDFYFKEVIKERSYLSKHFRNHRDQCETDEVDTINHEHFTESLKQIHRILLTAGKPAKQNKIVVRDRRSIESESSDSSAGKVQNSFRQLLIQDDAFIDSSDDDGAVSDTETNATSECSHSNLSPSECACEDDDCSTDLLDADGELDLAVQGIALIQFLKSMGKAVELCWRKAASRETSVAAAAATTNVLLSRTFSHIQRIVQNDVNNSSPKIIAMNIRAVTCDNHAYTVTLQEDLEDTLQHLVDTERIVLSTRSKVTLPSDHVPAVAEKLFLDIQSLSDHKDMPSLVLDGLASNSIVLDSQGAQDSILATTACLYLLAISHSAYSSSLQKANHVALPRISALKLANEALSTINRFIDNKTIFPCQCVDTLGFRVAQMKVELEGFAKYRSWNCLMQNPVIAGNHILEILDICSYYGLHMIHYRQWAAAVLHSYQALVILGYLAKVAWLEEVCDLLAPVLYTTSERPTSGFMASWLRYIGARLKFRKGKKYQDHKDTWCMAVPAHIAARSAGLNIRDRNESSTIQPKFDYGTVDLTMRSKHAGWTLQGDATVELDSFVGLNWSRGGPDLATSMPAQLPTTSKSRAAKHKQTKSCQIPKTCQSQPDHDCLKPDHVFDMSFAVDTSQGRNIPACKLNLLSLFHSMTQVVSSISDATHADQTNGAGRGQMCLCFVQTILRAADRVQDVRKRGGLDAKGAVLSKNEKECVECFKDNLNKVLEQAGTLSGQATNWLWSSI